LRKRADEYDHSQTGQGEEIGTPPAQGTCPRRGRPEEFTEMNLLPVAAKKYAVRAMEQLMVPRQFSALLSFVESENVSWVTHK
jgi:hypothetical protein